MIAEFIKFCVVGGSGVGVDFGITYLLKEKARINKYIANSAGFVCAATTNYILNRIWTFANHDPAITQQYSPSWVSPSWDSGSTTGLSTCSPTGCA